MPFQSDFLNGKKIKYRGVVNEKLSLRDVAIKFGGIFFQNDKVLLKVIIHALLYNTMIHFDRKF